MNTLKHLLTRLDAIGAAVATSGHALALIGLGSVGLERDRLDAYSDLDFFVIARSGCTPWFLDDLDWLAGIAPIAYQFRNTVDGYKVLYQDGIFCEFAVFEADDLASIPFSAGRIIWKAAEVDERIACPLPTAAPAMPPSVDWLLGEALTNLYIGLGRYHRGEKLSAARFIQSFAVDHVMALMAQIEQAQAGPCDPFAPERRYEQRFPATAAALPSFMQGYEGSCESALAMLTFLEARVAVNPMLAEAIRARVVQPQSPQEGS